MYYCVITATMTEFSPLFTKKGPRNNVGQEYWLKSNKPFILRQVLFILSEIFGYLICLCTLFSSSKCIGKLRWSKISFLLLTFCLLSLLTLLPHSCYHLIFLVLFILAIIINFIFTENFKNNRVSIHPSLRFLCC